MRFIPLLFALYTLWEVWTPRMRHKREPKYIWYYKSDGEKVLRMVKEPYIGYFSIQDFESMETLMFGNKKACVNYLTENGYLSI